MKVIIFLALFVFSCSPMVLADTEYQLRMKRIEKIRDEEIARSHELKKLELQYKIYCKEVDMQKDNQRNILINSPRMHQKSRIENTLNQRINRTKR